MIDDHAQIEKMLASGEAVGNRYRVTETGRKNAKRIEITATIGNAVYYYPLAKSGGTYGAERMLYGPGIESIDRL